MRACRKTNCVYVVGTVLCVTQFSISRIDARYAVTEWLPADGIPISSQNGNILLFEDADFIDAMHSYNANGDLLNTIALGPEVINDCLYPINSGVLQKENGNIVLTYRDHEYRATLLEEIDSNGKEVRKSNMSSTMDA